VERHQARISGGESAFVIGLSFIIEIAVDISPAFFRALPASVQPLVGSSLVAGMLAAILLNLIFRIGARRVQNLVLPAGRVDPVALEQFMEASGVAWGARRDVIDRARFNLTQSIETIVEGCEPQGPLEIAATFDEFNLDLRVMYSGPGGPGDRMNARRSAVFARHVRAGSARTGARFVPPLSGVKRVLPTQPGKAREVAIRRTEYQPMLDGKCGKVRILHQIRVNARRREKFAKNLAMAFGGLRNPYPLGREPGERLPPRVRHRFGSFKHARIGGQAQEREKARPGKADRRHAVQALIEPCARPRAGKRC
jgi:hypothetical protein